MKRHAKTVLIVVLAIAAIAAAAFFSLRDQLPELVRNYGYPIVFVGTFLEGETILVLGGFAAHQDFLDFKWVVLIAVIGGFLGDQVYFWLGRMHGKEILQRFPDLEARAAKVDGLLHRYHLLLIPAIRFMYGLRIIGPIAFGAGRVATWRFLLLNLIGALIWAPLIASAGYLFGHALQLLLADMHRLELIGLGMLLLFGLGGWAIHRLRGK